MRVNRNRLDLRSLTVGHPCTITTGIASVKLVQGRESIDMGLYLDGVGSLQASDRISSIENENDKGFRTEWLHLDALAPRRLYVVTVTNMGEGRQVSGWQIEDATPGKSEKLEPKPVAPWGVIGRLFRRVKGD